MRHSAHMNWTGELPARRGSAVTLRPEIGASCGEEELADRHTSPWEGSRGTTQRIPREYMGSKTVTEHTQDGKRATIHIGKVEELFIAVTRSLTP